MFLCKRLLLSRDHSNSVTRPINSFGRLREQPCDKTLMLETRCFDRGTDHARLPHLAEPLGVWSAFHPNVNGLADSGAGERKAELEHDTVTMSNLNPIVDLTHSKDRIDKVSHCSDQLPQPKSSTLSLGPM